MTRLNLLKLNSKEEYRNYFIKKYCNNEIYTFSGIKVKFYEDQFEHAFYESANHKKRDKSIFSYERAEKNNPLIAGSVGNLYTSFTVVKDYPIIIILHL